MMNVNVLLWLMKLQKDFSVELMYINGTIGLDKNLKTKEQE